MQTITHYEVYQASLGQWTMVARFTAGERDLAISHAKSIEDERRVPAAVIEDIEDLTAGTFDARLIHRSLTTGADIRVPPNASDLGSRFFMIALNGLAIGAIALVLAMVALGRANLSSSVHNLAVLGAFLGGTLLGGLMLFRLYIPVGVILWRSKDPESRKRTIMALGQGSVASDDEPATAPMAPPAIREFPAPMRAVLEADQAPPPPELGADATPPPNPADVPPPPSVEGETPAPEGTPPETAAVDPSQPAPDAPLPATTGSISDEVLLALVERNKGMLNMLADDGLTSLRPTRPILTPADRLGFSLYLLGATRAVAERNALDETTTRLLADSVLSRSRLSPEEIAAFFADLEVNGERPRYKSMIDHGRTGIGFMLGEVSGSKPLLPEILTKWNDPLNQTGEPQQVTFVLTDIVGSTAMTSEIGNAGAQRVVRAHNAICRAAAKAFRGREVKHTGDGMLMIFPDSTSGARAAIDIQQEGNTFALDNPAAPLVMRVGVHTGEAVFEDGEYFGPAVAAVNGIAAAAGNGEICISAVARQKLPTLLKAQEIDTRTVKGSATPIQLFRLLWEPKRAVGKAPVLEYRQIGANPGVPPAPVAAGSARR